MGHMLRVQNIWQLSGNSFSYSFCGCIKLSKAKAEQQKQELCKNEWGSHGIRHHPTYPIGTHTHTRHITPPSLYQKWQLKWKKCLLRAKILLGSCAAQGSGQWRGAKEVPASECMKIHMPQEIYYYVGNNSLATPHFCAPDAATVDIC